MARFWPLWHKFWPKKLFSWILPLLDVRNCYKLSLCASSRKTNKPNLRKWQKSYFRVRFWSLWHKFASKKLFRGFYLYCMLEIVTSCHFMDVQGKQMNQTWEDGKKPSFGPDFGAFGPDLDSKFFFVYFTCTRC